MANKIVVEATGVSTGAHGVSAKEIEQAMVEAVQRAYADGITDPDEIRRLQLEARDKARKGQTE